MITHLTNRQVGATSPSATKKAPPPRTPTALPSFPAPFQVNGINFWVRGAIRRYQADVGGYPFVPRDSDDEWLRSDAVRLLLGGVSAMWIHRRLRNSELDADPSPEAA